MVEGFRLRFKARVEIGLRFEVEFKIL